MKKIGLDATRKLLRKIINREGADTVRACYYSESYYRESERLPEWNGPDKPHCIVGCVAFEVGGEEALYALYEGSTALENAPALERMGFTNGAIELLAAAQEVQDVPRAWGEVLPLLHTTKS